MRARSGCADHVTGTAVVHGTRTHISGGWTTDADEDDPRTVTVHLDADTAPACDECAEAEREQRTPVVGLVEIADDLGVGHQTVKGWRARGLLDAYEVGTVSGAPAYDLDAVRRWYETDPPRAGRPPAG